MGHISTKLHQFLISSFRNLCGQTDKRTDTAKSNTCSQHSWHASKNGSDYHGAKLNDVYKFPTQIIDGSRPQELLCVDGASSTIAQYTRTVAIAASTYNVYKSRSIFMIATSRLLDVVCCHGSGRYGDVS